jgi:hypothetical protein
MLLIINRKHGTPARISPAAARNVAFFPQFIGFIPWTEPNVSAGHLWLPCAFDNPVLRFVFL